MTNTVHYTLTEFTHVLLRLDLYNYSIYVALLQGPVDGPGIADVP